MKDSRAGQKRVLVVEDEPAICEVCRRVLTSEGFKVDIAPNGSVAQDMLGARGYDLCLIDIRTPLMNGKQLWEYIMEKHKPVAGRVIFTSGDTTDEHTQRFLETTGRLFLPKPFTPDELRAVVAEALRQIEK